MIRVDFDDKQFLKEIANTLGYASGFLDGAELGKPTLMKNIAGRIKEILYEFIDTTARMEPKRLHHIYEWYQTGSPDARIYDLQCTYTGRGISTSYTFSQSKSVSNGASTPFYNKASIMENGIPVVIRPRNSDVLAFGDGDQTIFTRKPVHVDNPGGTAVQGALAETIKLFFNNYLSQMFLDVTGIRKELSDISEFNSGFIKSKSGGYNLGVETGKKWIGKVGTID